MFAQKLFCFCHCLSAPSGLALEAGFRLGAGLLAWTARSRRLNSLLMGSRTAWFPSAPCEDVGMYPDAMHAENSGFGLTMNYGNLAPGAHTLTILGTTETGATFTIEREIMTQQFGGFEFAEAMLADATMDRHGDAIALHGVQFSDPKPRRHGADETIELEWSNARGLSSPVSPLSVTYVTPARRCSRCLVHPCHASVPAYRSR